MPASDLWEFLLLRLPRGTCLTLCETTLRQVSPASAFAAIFPSARQSGFLSIFLGTLDRCLMIAIPLSYCLKQADGIRTLAPSKKLIKSRRNAHCLPCVYRLSTTWKSERKAVKGSAEQIHFTPLLLSIATE